MGGDESLEPLSRQFTSTSAATATTGGHSYEDGMLNAEPIQRTCAELT